MMHLTVGTSVCVQFRAIDELGIGRVRKIAVEKRQAQYLPLDYR